VAGSAIVQLIFSMAGREPSDESLAAVIKWSRYRRVPAHPEGASVNPNHPKAYRRRSRCRRHPDQRPQREQHGRRPVDLPDRTAARIGWDVPAQSITIDTRWSVPRYTPGLETETYLLNGEQLTPVANRTQLQVRTAEKVFQGRGTVPQARAARRQPAQLLWTARRWASRLSGAIVIGAMRGRWPVGSRW
jgi:hypothetical protein